MEFNSTPLLERRIQLSFSLFAVTRASSCFLKDIWTKKKKEEIFDYVIITHVYVIFFLSSYRFQNEEETLSLFVVLTSSLVVLTSFFSLPADQNVDFWYVAKLLRCISARRTEVYHCHTRLRQMYRLYLLQHRASWTNCSSRCIRGKKERRSRRYEDSIFCFWLLSSSEGTVCSHKGASVKRLRIRSYFHHGQTEIQIKHFLF